MSRSNPVMKVLGLCALVVGLMAMSAGTAQAEETGGSWNYINASGELKELPEGETAGGKLEGPTLVLISEVLKKKVEYICTSFTINEAKLIKGGTFKGKMTFHGCTAKIGGVTQSACEPNAEGKSKGLIKTNSAIGVLLLHKLADGTKHKIIIVKPETGTTFANIEMSELCSIGEKVPVLGSLALIDCQNEPTVHKVEHLFSRFAALSQLFVINETTEHKTVLEGSAFFFLTGPNAGRQWATLWN